MKVCEECREPWVDLVNGQRHRCGNRTWENREAEECERCGDPTALDEVEPWQEPGLCYPCQLDRYARTRLGFDSWRAYRESGNVLMLDGGTLDFGIVRDAPKWASFRWALIRPWRWHRIPAILRQPDRPANDFEMFARGFEPTAFVIDDPAQREAP